MKHKLLSFIALISISACAETEPVNVTKHNINLTLTNMVKSNLSTGLKDPESLKIRNLTAYKSSLGDRIVCGQYDAKNSFGGYNGYSPFYIRYRNGALASLRRSTGKSDDWLNTSLINTACSNVEAGSINLPS